MKGEDIMTYARWTSKEEMIAKLTPVNNDTVLRKVGTPITYDDNYLYISDKEAHNLVICCTGSGKTQSTILPTLRLAMMAKEPFVINDPKGELYTKLSNRLISEGYEVTVLNFVHSARCTF